MEPTSETSSSLTARMVNIPKYKGVRKRKWGKWVSEIRLPNSRERIWLGSYESAEKAARAFDAALYCLRGRGAKFNFPDNPPEIEGGESLGPQEIQVVAARYANEEPLRREAALQTRGIMEGGATQIEMSSNDECGAIDWSFLNVLEAGSEFGVHNNIMGDEYHPPPAAPPPPQSPPLFVDAEDPQDGHLYSQQSFLWNF